MGAAEGEEWEEEEELDFEEDFERDLERDFEWVLEVLARGSCWAWVDIKY